MSPLELVAIIWIILLVLDAAAGPDEECFVDHQPGDPPCDRDHPG